jgi:hypothetical protein
VPGCELDEYRQPEHREQRGCRTHRSALDQRRSVTAMTHATARKGTRVEYVWIWVAPRRHGAGRLKSASAKRMIFGPSPETLLSSG